jgi:hypothetical protein
MGFMTTVRTYLGLEPVPVLEQYRDSARQARLTCRTCGAFVAHEHQVLHTDWHLAEGR